MSALTIWLKPLTQAARAFFHHDLALRRDEDGMKIVLEDRASAAQRPSITRAQAAALKEKLELELMLEQLTSALDELPETRSTLRHLAFAERALTKKGLRALHMLPLDVLQTALEQFEGLIINWGPVGLAGLRAKMAVAVIDRERMDPDADARADAYPTSALMDNGSLLYAGSGLEVVERSDDEALTAAYAALGNVAPAGAQDKLPTDAKLRELQP